MSAGAARCLPSQARPGSQAAPRPACSEASAPLAPPGTETHAAPGVHSQPCRAPTAIQALELLEKCLKSKSIQCQALQLSPYLPLYQCSNTNDTHEELGTAASVQTNQGPPCLPHDKRCASDGAALPPKAALDAMSRPRRTNGRTEPTHHSGCLCIQPPSSQAEKSAKTRP